MAYPLIGLAALAAVGGLVNMPGWFTAFTSWLAARAHPIVEHHADGLNWALAALGTLAALAGIAAGTALFGRHRATQKERDRFRIPGFYPLLEHKYYVDDLYDYALVRPIRGPLARAANWSNNVILDGAVNAFGMAARRLASLVYGGLDQRGIDLGINAAAAAAGEAGGALRRVQTGKVQQYAAALFLGAVLLVVGFLIFG
jgi:NADH-quinone oxidoreductase subunit L